MEKEDKVLTAPEAANYLRICKKTLYRMVWAGKLNYSRTGNRYKFLQSELDRYLRGEISHSEKD